MFNHYKYLVAAVTATLMVGFIAWGQRYEQSPMTTEGKREYVEEVRLRAYQDGYQAAVEGLGPTDGVTNPPRYLRRLPEP